MGIRDFLLGIIVGGGVSSDNLENIGRRQQEEWEDKHSTYVPKEDSHYENRGIGNNEDWQWIEPKPTRKYYVNVMRETDGCTIRVDYERDANAVEGDICENMRQVHILIDMYKPYYEQLGKVYIDMGDTE